MKVKGRIENNLDGTIQLAIITKDGCVLVDRDIMKPLKEGCFYYLNLDSLTVEFSELFINDYDEAGGKVRYISNYIKL